MEQSPLVLLVDDELDFLEIFSTRLRSAGFRVETAKNGEEAISRAKALTPDLILMDIKMPGIDGVQTMLKLKDDPATKDAKVLFLTNLGDPQAEMQKVNDRFSREVGAVGYMKKIDDLETLTARVRYVFDH